MNTETHEEKNIKLEDLVNFRAHPSQTYEGKRLAQLMDSIERDGLIYPIIVRPIANGKYEILCGHNRAKAMEALGRDVIKADVRKNLSDEEATALYYDSNLNQQSFADWSYTQKIEAIKYYDTLIRNNSHQGKRNDLIKKQIKNWEMKLVSTLDTSQIKVQNGILPEIKWHTSLEFQRLHSANTDVL